MHSELIDTCERLAAFLDEIGDCEGQPPALYVDLEGNDLSRHGTLSLVTILVKPQERVYLIDVTTLKALAFDTASSSGQTLKTILEADDIIKVFFDIRNDSDALFSLYGICVRGIEDLQLMELASRSFNRRCVNGLAKCVEKDSTINFQDRRDWQRVKDEGRRFFDPARGGSFAVFDRRPLLSAVQEYCVQDVTFMPHLRSVYLSKLCDAWWSKIGDETKARIQLSQSSTFNGKGRHMALGPPTWNGWSPKMAERSMREDVKRVEGRSGVDEMVHPRSEGVDLLLPSGTGVLSLALIEGMRMMKVREHERLPSAEHESRYESRAVLGGGEENEAEDFAGCNSECGYCGKCSY